MLKSSIEKMANDIGFDIGTSDDVTQSNLINGLSRGLANSMQDHNLNLQLCYIVDKLDDKSCKIIKMLNEYIILKETN